MSPLNLFKSFLLFSVFFDRSVFPAVFPAPAVLRFSMCRICSHVLQIFSYVLDVSDRKFVEILRAYRNYFLHLK